MGGIDGEPRAGGAGLVAEGCGLYGPAGADPDPGVCGCGWGVCPAVRVVGLDDDGVAAEFRTERRCTSRWSAPPTADPLLVGPAPASAARPASPWGVLRPEPVLPGAAVTRGPLSSPVVRRGAGAACTAR
ncbi:hypothetical protein [Streptomyces microflavus]|uniref:hypothetical protein n=1 Tax=Streptomyces microflavus TaxID=1919 RepID=UPI0033AE25D4